MMRPFGLSRWIFAALTTWTAAALGQGNLPAHPPTATPGAVAAPAASVGASPPAAHGSTPTAKAAAGNANPHVAPPTSAAPGTGAAPGASATGTAAAPNGAAAARPAPANPHVGMNANGEVSRDESQPAGDLPKGTIEAWLLNEQDQPLANTEVRLAILFQRISEGESRTERRARTDESGRVTFSGLSTGSDFTYRVVAQSGPAQYGSPGFALADVGHRVRLHVYPVTSDLNQVLVGMRGFVYVEPRDEVFQFDVLYRVFNVGNTTWVPNDVVMELPEGFKAFKAQEGEGDAGFELVEGRGARLKGTFTPGQHDVNVRFQLPNQGDSSVRFRVGLLPHVAELRVIAEASSQMNLEVGGFETPQVSSNRAGNRVLVTRRLLQRGEEGLKAAEISLTGIPVPSSGRWIAVLIASGLAVLGWLSASGRVRLEGIPEQKALEDHRRARDLLLEECVRVEKARARGQLGPKAYADARKTLLDALSRLGPEALADERRKRRRSSAQAA
ncbi:MAG TPA: hypothetical protein VFQ61_01000 [Polyangiaceae bacterium]|nr:hypothetical protein [Polyangiaceae bacterium]